MNGLQNILKKSSLSHNSVTNGRNFINFFVCSSFEDFEIERRLLSSKVFPELRAKCFDNFGIEINLIDLKLGIDARHEVTNSYTDIFAKYLEEHGMCDQNNCPILLFGQKFGRPLIPNKIPIAIYELFKRTIRRYKNQFLIDGSVLDQYYKEDTSTSEKDMVFISASDFFPQLDSKDPAAIKDALNQWTTSKLLLSDLFKNLSNICLKNESLDLSTVRNLLTFELDNSITSVLRRSLDSNFLPIIYSRKIIDIKNLIVISNETMNEDRKLAIEKLIDVVYDKHHCMQIDDSTQIDLDQLWESCLDIYESLDPSIEILWRDGSGVSEMHHTVYLDQMAAFFRSKVYEAVIQREEFLITELQPNLMKCFDIVCDASVQVKRLSTLCCGLEDIVSALLAYIRDESESIPMYLFGPINSGKAIILAKTIYELQQANCDSDNYHVITRFVNSEFSLDEILMSIFYQISAIVLNQEQFKTIIDNSKEIDRNIPKDLEGILMSFQHATSAKFVIVLHDLEKCCGPDTLIQIENFIPTLLPVNMKLIVTTTERWEDRQRDLLNLAVPEFSITEYNSFIQTQLVGYGKVLNQEQSELLVQPYLKVINDIFTAKLVTNILKNYRSFEPYPDKAINDTNDILNEIVNINFKKYGNVLISHIIGLLHCSNGGLTNQEMTDILTLDNDVINEVTWFHPFSLIKYNEILQFPSSLWLLIRFDLSSILIEKIRDGYIIIDLANKSIFETVVRLNESIDPAYFYKLLAEYYLGLWFSSKKLFVDDSKNEILYTCLTRDQQMLSKCEEKIFYNYRKFRQLVHQLVQSKMNGELLSEVIFNFDWLYNKIKALGVFELLKDFKSARNGSKEIILLEESFRNSANVVDKDLDSLAGELIGQLLPYVSYYPNLRLLIENCDTVAPQHNAFIPIYANDKLPGSPLASTICCPAAIESMQIIKNQINQNDELLLKIKGDCRIYFYDLKLGVIVSSTLVSHGIVYFGENSDIIFLLESKFRQVIKIHDRTSGDLLGQIIPMNWVVPRPFENKHDYRITHIDIGQTKAALIMTNEVSYLFIVTLDTYEPVLAFNPGVKLLMLKLSIDESKVFCHHGEKLISFDILTNKPNSAVELQGNPVQMIFSLPKFNKAFIVCNEQKGVVVLELDKSGAVNKCYKISFDNCLDNDDFVKEVSCSQLGNAYMLIRSAHSVLLYDFKREKVMCHVTRPLQLPIYFKLPNQIDNQPASLQFNAAKLILADRVLACSLFRDVILCGVSDNRVLTTLHAPVGGIVSEIFVNDDFLIGKVDQNDEAAEIMIWRTETSGLFSKIETLQDRLTKAVREIHTGPSVAIATCTNSDEMGVIEVSTGTLVDLYSHASRVLNSCLSICGKYALVTVDSRKNSNILWSLEARRIILEFGHSVNASFLVPLQSVSGFLCITNYSVSIDDSQVVVTQINCDDTIEDCGYSMKTLELDICGFISEAPCALNGDKTLIALSNDYKREEGCVICDRILTIWGRESNSSVSCSSVILRNEDLSQQVNRRVTNILSVRSTSRSDDRVMVLCYVDDANMCSLTLDCSLRTVVEFTEVMASLQMILDIKEVYLSLSGTYMFDEGAQSIIDMCTGVYIGRVLEDTLGQYKFQCFALRDTVLVLSQKYKLTAWRLPELTKIGQVELKEEVTHIAKCADDFTMLIGCRDGSVVSYAIVDAFSPYSNLSEIKVVRNFRPMSKSPTIQLDSVNDVDTMSSKVSIEFEQKTIRRPASDPVVGMDRRDFLLSF